MIESKTERGAEFGASALVKVRGRCYDIDRMTYEQRRYVSGKLKEQMLNACFAGRASFKAQGLPPAEELFP